MGVNDTDVATFGALWFHHLSYPHELLEAFKFNEISKKLPVTFAIIPPFLDKPFCTNHKPPECPPWGSDIRVPPRNTAINLMIPIRPLLYHTSHCTPHTRFRFNLRACIQNFTHPAPLEAKGKKRRHVL
jgi:hypothetical protein